MTVQVTDEMAERLSSFLQREWAGPYIARMRDFIPDLAMPLGPERDAALAALRAADEEAEQQALTVARAALEFALLPPERHVWVTTGTIDTGHQPPRLLWRCTCGNQEWGTDDSPPPCAWSKAG
jgi:hypothetical protein